MALPCLVGCIYQRGLMSEMLRLFGWALKVDHSICSPECLDVVQI
jgi:hypothetical protein